MVYIAIALFLIGIALNIWVKWTLQRYMTETEQIRGTGGELANYLLESASLPCVKVQTSDQPDHYNPLEKHINLSEATYSKRSLTAVVVAAHEFGHALQDADQMPTFRLRTLLARALAPLDMLMSGSLLLLPLFSLAAGGGALRLTFLIIIFVLAIKMLVHLITLPVELDASFNKALPILQEGGFISQAEVRPARRILTAAALTYVAGAVGSVFNIFFWLRALR